MKKTVNSYKNHEFIPPHGETKFVCWREGISGTHARAIYGSHAEREREVRVVWNLHKSTLPPHPCRQSHPSARSRHCRRTLVIKAIRPLVAVEIKTSTTILHTSWKTLFTSLNTVNESGNHNIAGVNRAMDGNADLDVKMTWLTQPLGLLLVANNSKEVSVIHHRHNFGRTLLLPTHKVGCPSIRDIKACLMANNIKALITPRASGVVNLAGISCIIPAPFLRNAILLADSSSPLELILAGQAT